MKKNLLFFCLLPCASLQAQTIINGEISHAETGEKIEINLPFDNWFYKQNSYQVSLNEKGGFSFSLPVTKPQTVFLDFAGQRFHLYAEPDKTLSVKDDARNLSETMAFEGGLSAENAFRK